MVHQDSSGVGFRTTVFPNFYRDQQQGRGLLQFGRVGLVGSDLRYRLVAELDGPVRVAFLQANPPGEVCELADSSLTDSRYIFEVWGLRVRPDGIIAGGVGDRYPDAPNFVRTGLDNHLASWWATPGWFVTVAAEVTAESWDGATRLTIPDLPRPLHRVTGTSSELFFEYGDHSGTVVWTPDAGTKPFLPRPSDAPMSRTAGNFMTDGKDLVWLSVVRSISGEDLSTMELWTAPFTTNQEELEKTARRVAAFPYGIGPYPLALGCGYVAAINGVGTGGPDLVVVRLQDSAKFEAGARSVADGWAITQTLGVNCRPDESEPEVIAILSEVQGWDPLAAASSIVRFPIAHLKPAMTDGGM